LDLISKPLEISSNNDDDLKYQNTIEQLEKELNLSRVHYFSNPFSIILIIGKK